MKHLATLFGQDIIETFDLEDVDASQVDAILARDTGAAILGDYGDAPVKLAETGEGWLISGEQQVLFMGGDGSVDIKPVADAEDEDDDEFEEDDDDDDDATDEADEAMVSEMGVEDFFYVDKFDAASAKKAKQALYHATQNVAGEATMKAVARELVTLLATTKYSGLRKYLLPSVQDVLKAESVTQVEWHSDEDEQPTIHLVEDGEHLMLATPFDSELHQWSKDDFEWLTSGEAAREVYGVEIPEDYVVLWDSEAAEAAQNLLELDYEPVGSEPVNECDDDDEFEEDDEDVDDDDEWDESEDDEPVECYVPTAEDFAACLNDIVVRPDFPSSDISIRNYMEAYETALREGDDAKLILAACTIMDLAADTVSVSDDAELEEMEEGKEEARELELFIENDGELNRQQHMPIIKNLVTKIARGKYDERKAVKGFMHLVDAGAKKYVKEFGSKDDAWHKMFDKPTRTMVATSLRDSFKEEADLGNFDDLLPKKYQKSAGKKGKRRASEADEAGMDKAKVLQAAMKIAKKAFGADMDEKIVKAMVDKAVAKADDTEEAIGIYQSMVSSGESVDEAVEYAVVSLFKGSPIGITANMGKSEAQKYKKRYGSKSDVIISAKDAAKLRKIASRRDSQVSDMKGIKTYESESDEADPTKIKIEHPGITKLPEDAWSNWGVSKLAKHFVGLAGDIGKGPAMRAMLNIERWNKNRHPELSEKARSVIDRVQATKKYRSMEGEAGEPQYRIDRAAIVLMSEDLLEDGDDLEELADLAVNCYGAQDTEEVITLVREMLTPDPEDDDDVDEVAVRRRTVGARRAALKTARKPKTGAQKQKLKKRRIERKRHIAKFRRQEKKQRKKTGASRRLSASATELTLGTEIAEDYMELLRAVGVEPQNIEIGEEFTTFETVPEAVEAVEEFLDATDEATDLVGLNPEKVGARNQAGHKPGRKSGKPGQLNRNNAKPHGESEEDDEDDELDEGTAVKDNYGVRDALSAAKIKLDSGYKKGAQVQYSVLADDRAVQKVMEKAGFKFARTGGGSFAGGGYDVYSDGKTDVHIIPDAQEPDSATTIFAVPKGTKVKEATDLVGTDAEKTGATNQAGYKHGKKTGKPGQMTGGDPGKPKAPADTGAPGTPKNVGEEADAIVSVPKGALAEFLSIAGPLGADEDAPVESEGDSVRIRLPESLAERVGLQMESATVSAVEE